MVFTYRRQAWGLPGAGAQGGGEWGGRAQGSAPRWQGDRRGARQRSTSGGGISVFYYQNYYHFHQYYQNYYYYYFHVLLSNYYYYHFYIYIIIKIITIFKWYYQNYYHFHILLSKLLSFSWLLSKLPFYQKWSNSALIVNSHEFKAGMNYLMVFWHPFFIVHSHESKAGIYIYL